MGIKITGIDTPFGGVSWEFTEAEKKGVQKLFYLLESKRLLTNPIEMEVKRWCEQSALEIKCELTNLLSQYSFSEQTTTCFRCMVSACNDFLDKIGKVEETGIIYKNQSGDWENSLFSSAMKQFRKTFRENINTLSCAYDLVFHNEIPEQY